MQIGTSLSEMKLLEACGLSSKPFHKITQQQDHPSVYEMHQMVSRRNHGTASDEEHLISAIIKFQGPFIFTGLLFQITNKSDKFSTIQYATSTKDSIIMWLAPVLNIFQTFRSALSISCDHNIILSITKPSNTNIYILQTPQYLTLCLCQLWEGTKNIAIPLKNQVTEC